MGYLESLPNFLIYFLASISLLAIFITIYVRVTPYRELRLIRAGNTAASLSLLGALGGFALPLASAISHSTSFFDMLAWGGVALVVQVGLYKVLVGFMPEIAQGIPQGHVAHGVFLGGVSVVVGLLNAACMTY
ncbi:Predicted membrane protein [gamma proteobacterium HdN1]|nr:Predicted membrane protein [gamma proteobacterium HdN1]